MPIRCRWLSVSWSRPITSTAMVGTKHGRRLLHGPRGPQRRPGGRQGGLRRDVGLLPERVVREAGDRDGLRAL
eukprot:6088569-Pyramimonas_sp.AAC.1